MATWFELVNPIHLKTIPADARDNLVSDNGISKVYVGDEWVYKRSQLFFTQNEWAFLSYLNAHSVRFVPSVLQFDRHTLAIKKLTSEPVTDDITLVAESERFRLMCEHFGIRHGDLTRPHIFVKKNSIKVIDWAESRWKCDRAPDKRPEGDAHWMERTMNEILKESGFDVS